MQVIKDMINVFKSIRQSSKIQGNSTTEEFLNIIQNGNEFLHYILKARKALRNGNKRKYDEIKKSKIPAYAHNFTFKETRKNANILESTGYIFLDIDYEKELDFQHPLIHATWSSLSDLGRGLLVKVEGITKENFSYNYTLLGEELKLNVDTNANKATQINVLSFDEEIYKNPSSKIWKAIEEPSKIPHYSKENQKTSRVKNVLGHSGPTRWDNVQEFVSQLDFQDAKMFDNGSKILLSKIYHSFRTPEGKRYSFLNAKGFQFRALNPHIGYYELKNFLEGQNRFCSPPLPEVELNRIIKNISEIPPEELEPKANYPRRFFFDESEELTSKEKRQLMMSKINKERVEKSKREIKEAIDRWNFEECGVINQKKLAEQSGKSYNTVQKYYSEFKDRIQILNTTFKNNKEPP
ncbi:hypothetical protein [Salinimicrobium xinjiangense]|uniref:hypothetical protein n=1 Tax=Salinimicrobium xinjiangense TaxID=438596 RepID=UPI00040129E3|nr:hypothetical protein [Salinimicrobium xinjiangense]